MTATIKCDPSRLPVPFAPKPIKRQVRVVVEEKHLPIKKREQTAWTEDRDRVLIQLRHEGKTMQQCADELGTTRGAINKRLARLRRRGEI